MQKDAPTPHHDPAEDDDIVDLLEVVKPGRAAAEPASEEEVDFSGDLDAMLQELAKASEAKEAESDEPFPDPTPVSHAVDADEELDMPGMDDLSALLDTLGQGSDAPSAKPEAAPGEPPDFEALLRENLDQSPAQSPEEASPAPPMSANAADMDWVDTMLAANGLDPDADLNTLPDFADKEKTVASAPEPSALPEPEPDPVPVDLDDLPALSAPPKSPATESPAPAPEESVTLEADAPESPAAPPPAASPIHSAPTIITGNIFDQPARAPKAASTPGPAPEPEPVAVPEPVAEPTAEAAPEPAAPARFGEVDLNELDALLDDMLAQAPPSGPVNADVRFQAPPEDTAPAVSPLPAAESMDLAPVLARLDGLDAALADVLAKVDATEDALESLREEAPPTLTREELDDLRTDLQKNRETLDTDLKGLSQAQDELSAEHQAAVQELSARLDAKDNEVQRLSTENQDLKQGLEQARAALEDLRANMDKLAAEAAARVIREEIAALLQG